MKAKKALKRLNKVESLLSNVIEQFPDSARGLRDLLDSARSSVVRAKETHYGLANTIALALLIVLVWKVKWLRPDSSEPSTTVAPAR